VTYGAFECSKQVLLLCQIGCVGFVIRGLLGF